MRDIEVKKVYKQYSDGNVDEYCVGLLDAWSHKETVNFIKYHEPQGEGDAH